MKILARVIRYLFWFIFTVGIAWLVKKAFQPASERSQVHAGGARQAMPGPPTPKRLFRDPVCGTYVAEGVSVHWTQGSETLHFCSRECFERYRARNRVGARA